VFRDEVNPSVFAGLWYAVPEKLEAFEHLILHPSPEAAAALHGMDRVDLANENLLGHERWSERRLPPVDGMGLHSTS
jgi:hypothetical protein